MNRGSFRFTIRTKATHPEKHVTWKTGVCYYTVFGPFLIMKICVCCESPAEVKHVDRKTGRHEISATST